MPLTVVQAPGRKISGRKMTTPVGIVVHHTASSAKAAEANVVAMCIRGVPLATPSPSGLSAVRSAHQVSPRLCVEQISPIRFVTLS